MFDPITAAVPSSATDDTPPAPDAMASTPSVITGLTLESLRAVYQAAGYRVEVLGDGDVTFLRSATNGLPFDIRPGNVQAGKPDEFVDFALVALFAVRGTVPFELLNTWNRTRRYGRLFLDRPVPEQEFLVFCCDVSVLGGVTPAQLRAQIEIGDGLMQQLVPWLREELAKIAPSVAPPRDAAV